MFCSFHCTGLLSPWLILRCFVLFVATVNGITFVISFSDFSLLSYTNYFVCRLCILLLHWIHWLAMTFFVVESLGFLNKIISCVNTDNPAYSLTCGCILPLLHALLFRLELAVLSWVPLSPLVLVPSRGKAFCLSLLSMVFPVSLSEMFFITLKKLSLFLVSFMSWNIELC